MYKWFHSGIFPSFCALALLSLLYTLINVIGDIVMTNIQNNLHITGSTEGGNGVADKALVGLDACLNSGILLQRSNLSYPSTNY